MKFSIMALSNSLARFSLAGPILVLLASAINAAPQETCKFESSVDAFLGSAKFEKQTIFKGERFPNLVVSTEGTLIATWGSSAIRARRSTDGGKTWGDEIMIATSGIQGGGTTVDETTGDILVFVEDAHPPAPIKMFRSSDDGKTWKEDPTTIHPDSKGNAPSMHMNEHGITLRHGKHAGRLIRPSRFYAGDNDKSKWPEHYTNAIYSDDHGKTWKTSEPFPENGTGEATTAELSDGTLYYNSRVHWQDRPKNTRRRSAVSDDGGQTWSDFRVVDILPDGHQHRSYGCMGGLVRLPIEGTDILLFSNLDTKKAKRERATVWASFDGGKTWPIKRLANEGPSAYSSMNAGRPGTSSEGWIYLNFEGKGTSEVAQFNLSWVLAGDKTGDGTVPAKFLAMKTEVATNAKLNGQDLPLVFAEDFEDGHANWKTTDDEAWTYQKLDDGNQVFGLNRRKSDYKPTHRSPHNIALIKGVEVADFVLTFDVRSTKDTGNHRDCCIFFAHQDPTHFYYAHLGARPDPNSGQIMIVKDAPRTAITKNEKLVPWDDDWHTVKVTRNSMTGEINIYFDDMDTPQMSATDKNFGKGKIGLGSFDDMNDFDNVRLYGK